VFIIHRSCYHPILFRLCSLFLILVLFRAPIDHKKKKKKKENKKDGKKGVTETTDTIIHLAYQS
jgi:hypothetical protein